MSAFPAEPLAAEEEGVWAFLVRVPEHSPFFEGHFPGNPILPGVAQLALCAELLRATLGPDARLLGIRTLRYKSPALPGDELTVRLARAARPGEITLSIRRQQEDIASGALLVPGDALPPRGEAGA